MVWVDQRARTNAGELEVLDSNLHRQFAGLAGLEQQLRILAFNAVYTESQQIAGAWRGCLGRFGCRRRLQRRMLKMRAGRQIDIQAIKFNHGDLERLALGEDQRRMKAKLPEVDHWLGRCGLRGRGNLNPRNARGRPDAQALALGPHSPMAAKAVAHRQMEAVELDARMKAFSRPSMIRARRYGSARCASTAATMARAATPTSNRPPTHMIHRFLRQKDL